MFDIGVRHFILRTEKHNPEGNGKVCFLNRQRWRGATPTTLRCFDGEPVHIHFTLLTCQVSCTKEMHVWRTCRQALWNPTQNGLQAQEMTLNIICHQEKCKLQPQNTTTTHPLENLKWKRERNADEAMKPPERSLPRRQQGVTAQSIFPSDCT